MASSKALPLVAMLLLLLPMMAFGDDLLAPSYKEEVCEKVNCGKGTCVANISYPLNYICQCDPGWKRTPDGNDDFEFLPCVLPNCSLNYQCQPAPPPVPQKTIPYNLSFFDPCYWVYCGEGTCRNIAYTKLYSCSCNPGYDHLVNESFYPCYSPCTIGSDCSSLGVRISGSQATTNTTLGGSRASSILPGKFPWIIVLLMPMIVNLWK